MYEFHKDKNRYFEMQKWVTEKFIIPFLEVNSSPQKVLEIGCAEAGVLKAFLEQGHEVVGIELAENRVALAKEFLSEEIAQHRAEIINRDIYDIEPSEQFKFDIIILKDVIEHIHDQAKFISKMHDFLLPNGLVFFAYPPWWMPFGGHQQLCKSKIISKVPWFHLFPASIYRIILKSFGESQATIESLLEIKSTGILIEEIHRLIKQNGFKKTKETFWITNPIYVKKFNFKPIKSFINIPYLRNFYNTSHYIAFKELIQ